MLVVLSDPREGMFGVLGAVRIPKMSATSLDLAVNEAARHGLSITVHDDEQHVDALESWVSDVIRARDTST